MTDLNFPLASIDTKDFLEQQHSGLFGPGFQIPSCIDGSGNSANNPQYASRNGFRTTINVPYTRLLTESVTILEMKIGLWLTDMTVERLCNRIART